jgi:uncharacterized protein Usg
MSGGCRKTRREVLLADSAIAANALIVNGLFNISACNAYCRDWKLNRPIQTEDAMGSMVSSDFQKQVQGFGLTTAHILYRRPDHQWLLQTYVWQAYDLFPKFPELQKFLAFWQEKLEGPLHSVQVAHCKLIKPAELKPINGEFRLH